MPLPVCTIKLNDYTIAVSKQEFTVEGPDTEIARGIGERFQGLIVTHEGYGLLAKVATYDDAEDVQQLWSELIDRLGVPPSET
jgi:hypothetical protein